MGDQPSPSQPPTRPSVPWRVRHSPMTSGVAMLLFLVPAALWLLAGASGSGRRALRPSRYGDPSLTPLHIWCVVGIVGAVLALGALVQVGWTLAEQRDWTQASVRYRLLGVAVAASAGVTVEFLLLRVVTAHELAIAPSFDSGEGTLAIAVLAIGQPVLVAALALLCNRLLPERNVEKPHAETLGMDWDAGHRRDGAYLRGLLLGMTTTGPSWSSIRASSAPSRAVGTSGRGGPACSPPWRLSPSWLSPAHPASSGEPTAVPSRRAPTNAESDVPAAVGA